MGAFEETKEDHEPDPAPQRSVTFAVTLLRKKGLWGMSLDFWPEGASSTLKTPVSPANFQIIRIDENGPVSEYNKSVEGVGNQQQIQLYDAIIEVNGEPASARLYKSMSSNKAKSLKMIIVRPLCFNIRASRGKPTWGMTVKFQEKRSTCVNIKEILKGFVAVHSALDGDDHRPRARKLEANDLIQSVNEISGDPKQMLRVLNDSGTVELIILRLLPAE